MKVESAPNNKNADKLKKEAAQVQKENDEKAAAAAAAEKKRLADIESGKYDFVKSELPSMRIKVEEAIKEKRDALREARDADRKCEDKRQAAADAVSTQIETEYNKIIERLVEQLNTKNRLLNDAQSKNNLDQKELTRLKELSVEIDRLKKQITANEKAALDAKEAAVEAEKAKQLKEQERLTKLLQDEAEKVAKAGADEVAQNKALKNKDVRIEALTKFIKKEKEDREALYKEFCEKLMSSIKDPPSPEPDNAAPLPKPPAKPANGPNPFAKNNPNA